MMAPRRWLRLAETGEQDACHSKGKATPSLGFLSRDCHAGPQPGTCSLYTYQAAAASSAKSIAMPRRSMKKRRAVRKISVDGARERVWEARRARKRKPG